MDFALFVDVTFVNSILLLLCLLISCLFVIVLLNTFIVKQFLSFVWKSAVENNPFVHTVEEEALRHLRKSNDSILYIHTL